MKKHQCGISNYSLQSKNQHGKLLYTIEYADEGEGGERAAGDSVVGGTL